MREKSYFRHTRFALQLPRSLRCAVACLVMLATVVWAPVAKAQRKPKTLQAVPVDLGRSFVSVGSSRLPVVDGDVAYRVDNRKIFAHRLPRGTARQLAFDGTPHSLAVLDGRGWLATGGLKSATVLNRNGRVEHRFEGHFGPVQAVAFAPSGEFLATLGRLEAFGYPSAVKLWSLRSGKLTATLQDTERRIVSMAFAPQGDVLATCSVNASDVLAGGTLTFWELNGRRVVDIPLQTPLVAGPAHQPPQIVFSADGGNLAVVPVADAESRTLGTTIVHRRKRDAYVVRGAFSAAFLVEGRVALGYKDGKISFLNLRTLVEQLALSGHRASVQTLAASSSGRWLVSGSRDWEIRIWDAREGNLIAVLASHKEEVRHVEFFDRDRRLLSVGRTCKVWDLRELHAGSQ